MKYILSLAFALTTGLLAMGQGIEFREMSYQEAQELSQKENKPIFMDCYTTWCGPCKWMAANMFTREDLGNYFNENFICVKFDMEKGQGLELAEEFSIKAYPSLLFLNAKGQVLNKMVGASRVAEDYIMAGEMARSEDLNMLALKERKQENFNDPEFMRQYIKTFGDANMLEEGELSEYLQQFPVEEWAAPHHWEIISSYVHTYDSDVFKKVMADEQAFGEEGATYVENILYYDLAQKFSRANNEEKLAAFNERKDELMAHEIANADRLEFRLNSYMLQKNKEWEKYCQNAMAKVAEYYWDDANQLNMYAWNFYENTKDAAQLKQASKWAARAVELERNHQILDTYANLLFATGKAQQALEIESEALELAREAGDDTSNYEEVIKKIKTAMKS